MNPMQIAHIYGVSRNQSDRKTFDTQPLKRYDTKMSTRNPDREEWGNQSFDSLVDHKTSDEDVRAFFRTNLKPTLIEKTP